MDVFIVKVVKGKTYRQRITKQSWDAIGSDKNGWVLESEQSVSNGVGKGQIVKNSVAAEPKKAEPKAEEENKAVIEPQKSPEITDQKKEEFAKAAEGLSKTAIKDYFQGCTPPVAFANSTGLPKLVEMLGEHLKYDVVSLQNIFS